jgi:hypothetical protein
LKSEGGVVVGCSFMLLARNDNYGRCSLRVQAK